MLVKQQIASGTINDIGMIREFEAKTPEKSRLEVELHLPSWTNNETWSKIVNNVIKPANEQLKGRVDSWPEQKDIITRDGSTVRIRWYKNPLWFEVIWSILRPLLIVVVIAAILYGIIWVLNRYYPQAIPQLKSNAWAIVGVIAMIAIIPFLPSLMESRTYE